MGRKNDTVLTFQRTGMLGAGLNTVTAGAGGTTGAATLHASTGKVTTATATAAAAGTYTLTLTNNLIEATDIVFATVAGGGAGQPGVSSVTPAAGSVVIVIENMGGSTMDAALVIGFMVVKVT